MQSWNQFFKRKSGGSGEYWLTVSDLMAALMVIFLFISIAYMQRVLKIVVAWDKTQDVIYEQLVNQFEEDIDEWRAEFDKARLTIRFKDPDTLFTVGDSTLKPEFKLVLSEFCPRYFQIVDGFIEEIDEVRIEGHTSPEWNRGSSAQEAYFENMKLSQARTRAVMEYCLSLEDVQQYDWAQLYLRAVGMSSAELRYLEPGVVDRDSSRRVEFRIKTRAEERITRILEDLR